VKCHGKILAVKDNLAKIEVDTDKLKAGMPITVTTGKKRSNKCNAFYWLYLTYTINECGLKEKGFFCPEALHASLKAHFLSEKILDKGKFKLMSEGTTTELCSKEMTAYLEKVDLFICDFFGVDTSAFFITYQNMYAPGE